MSGQIDDWESAFPVLPPVCGDGHPPAGYPYPQPGMSLRDWFAGMALTAMSAPGSDWKKRWEEEQADRAYELADAMIAARNRRNR